jgi:hypothetical protein
MKAGTGRLAAAILFAAMVLSLMGAGGASAAVWKHKGKAVTSFFELGLSGGVEVARSFGAVQCTVHAALTSEGGGTGKITKFEQKNCVAIGSGLVKCSVAVAEAKGLPWTVDVSATTLTLTSFHPRYTFQVGCGTTELDATFPSSTLTPDSTSSISELFLFGSIVGAETAGSFTVDAPNGGTYGIG